jgi:hypothetical protein
LAVDDSWVCRTFNDDVISDIVDAAAVDDDEYVDATLEILVAIENACTSCVRRRWRWREAKMTREVGENFIL